MDLLGTARSALAYFFGVTKPPWPFKLLFVGLTLTNIALTAYLAFRPLQYPIFRVYLLVYAAAAVVQNSKLWGMFGEVAIAAAGLLFTGEVMVLTTRAIHGQERRWSRVTAAMIGAVGFFMLVMIAPKPWPNYPPELYYARIYSVTAYCSTALGCVIWMWSQGKPVQGSAMRHAIIAVFWFAAILWVPVGIRRLHLNYWFVGNMANLVQIVCLIAWLTNPIRPESLQGDPAGDQ